MKKIILIISFLTLSLCGSAQSVLPKQSVSVGLSANVSKDITMMSMPIIYSHQIAGIPNLRYLIGVRQNLIFGQADFKINNQDALVDDLSNYFINIMGGVEFISNQNLLIGFNIDLLGGTLGTRSYKSVGKDPVYFISPESFNVMLGGDNDKGSLHSEFYLGYSLNEQLTLKAGLAHIRLGLYYSNNIINQTSTHAFLNSPFVNIQYTLWQK
jgi:hypothetical protein